MSDGLFTDEQIDSISKLSEEQVDALANSSEVDFNSYLDSILPGNYGYSMQDYSSGDFMFIGNSDSKSNDGNSFGDAHLEERSKLLPEVNPTGGANENSNESGIEWVEKKIKGFGEWASKNKELSTMMANGIAAGITQYISRDLRKAQERQANSVANASLLNANTAARAQENKEAMQNSGAGVSLGIMAPKYKDIRSTFLQNNKPSGV